MAEEYRAIVDAGFLLQLDCPDIPMAGHTEFWCKDRSRARADGFAARNVAAIDDGAGGHRRPSAFGCTCAGATTRARTTSTRRCAS